MTARFRFCNCNEVSRSSLLVLSGLVLPLQFLYRNLSDLSEISSSGIFLLRNEVLFMSISYCTNCLKSGGCDCGSDRIGIIAIRTCNGSFIW